MRHGHLPTWTAFVAAAFLVLRGATAADAQVNLPPPPPPPISQPSDLPPPRPPPPARTTGPTPPPPPRPPPREPPPPPPAAPPYRARAVRREEVVIVEEPETRTMVITLNPLPLVYGRLSANVELLLAPHHALVVSPNVLVLNADRGSRTIVSDGFGFASPTSAGFGVEVGYHYFLRWARSLRGFYFGPSVLVGATSNAEVGDPTTTQGYYGFAFDLGRQEVLPGGFTLGGGVGVGAVRMADTVAVFPRLLIQLGWSF